MKPLDSFPNEWSLPEKGLENTPKPLDSAPNEWSPAEKGREDTPSPSVNGAPSAIISLSTGSPFGSMEVTPLRSAHLIASAC